MTNMKILEVLTSLSIYHGCSNWKTFWEEKCTGEEKFTLGEFTPVNIKNCGCQNVRKHREIKDSDKYITLDISLNFGSLDKMRVTSSESKYNFGRSGKGLITSMGIKAKSIPKKYKRQGIPSEISVRRNFQRLLGSLKNYLMKDMGKDQT